MRHSSCVFAGAGLALVLITSTSVAFEGQGLTVTRDAVPWATWQGRVSVGGGTSFWRTGALDIDAQRPASMSLMGDYYFTRSLLGLGIQGGFRATSGLIVGPRSQAWSGQPGLTAGSTFSAGSRLFGNTDAIPYLRDPSAETATLPYVGVGYTGLSARGGWSFSADLGLIAQTPGNARLGRLFGSGQNLDDVVRDLRMAPMFQLGVSYAF